MKIFTGDTHFNHQGILKHRTFGGKTWGWRKFKTVREMNNTLIQNWNEVVKPGDLVYHLGDFALPNKGDGNDVYEILMRLNGQIILVMGNHDDKNEKLFEGHPKIAKIKHLVYMKLDNGQKVMLCHYPMLTWRASVHGSWHIHGHCHGNLPDIPGKRLDGGVDCHNLFPLTEGQVIGLMNKLPENLDEKNKRREG